MIEWKNQLVIGMWGGDEEKSVIVLFCWTGMRSSDAATFEVGGVTRQPTPPEAGARPESPSTQSDVSTSRRASLASRSFQHSVEDLDLKRL